MFALSWCLQRAGASQLLQHALILGLPVGGTIFAAVLFPKEHLPRWTVPFAVGVYLILVAFSIQLNVSMWQLYEGAPAFEFCLRMIVTFGSTAAVLATALAVWWLQGRHHWTILKRAYLVYASVRVACVLLLHHLGPVASYPPGHVSFSSSMAMSLTSMVTIAVLDCEARRLWLADALWPSGARSRHTRECAEPRLESVVNHGAALSLGEKPPRVDSTRRSPFSASDGLHLLRVASVCMLLIYYAYAFFQLLLVSRAP